MRASNSEHWQAFKAGTFRLLNMVGVSNLLPMTRMKTTSALSRYHMQQETEHFIPIDVLFDAELVAGAPVLTELLCKMHGCKMVPETETGASTMVNLESMRLSIGDAMALLNLTIKRAGEDGVLDARERQDIDQLCEEVIRTVRDVQKGVRK